MYQSSISAALSNSNYIASQITTIYQLESQYSAATGSDKEQIASQLNSLNKQLNSKMNDAYDSYNEFTNLSIFLISYFINNIFQIIFAKLQRKIVEIFTYEQIANFILFFLSYSINILNGNLIILKELTQIPRMWECKDLAMLLVRGIWIVALRPPLWYYFYGPELLWYWDSARSLDQWLRLLELWLKSLWYLQFYLDLYFQCLCSQEKYSFFQLDEFNSFNLTAQYLFYAWLGTFSFQTFEVDMVVSKYVGYAYIVLFVIFMNVVLLNFLIAILSDIYGILKQK